MVMGKQKLSKDPAKALKGRGGECSQFACCSAMIVKSS